MFPISFIPLPAEENLRDALPSATVFIQARSYDMYWRKKKEDPRKFRSPNEVIQCAVLGLTASVDRSKESALRGGTIENTSFNLCRGKKFLGDRNIARALFIFKQICL
ncbi:hypothetical protein CEXT_511821 [Caerostris extrusa]|uniref:Uncharacterized protein n=1 Tax=Caerostris extrusa TaxID=172846 RepID=A0AAV4MBK7_CAEEX|nr:hypothetical protein CEXT_511821 [Caerostris extrusa]